MNNNDFLYQFEKYKGKHITVPRLYKDYGYSCIPKTICNINEVVYGTVFNSHCTIVGGSIPLRGYATEWILVSELKAYEEIDKLLGD
jgi:hypothetical protein